MGSQRRSQSGAQTTTSSSGPPASLQWAARRVALRELAHAACCGCGNGLRHHIHLRLGSTLFYDDDPHRLMQSFGAAERSFITPQVLAAYIVLAGRERIQCYATEPPQIWPAFELLAKAEGHE